jgi:glucose/arabinose dehydrogenase
VAALLLVLVGLGACKEVDVPLGTISDRLGVDLELVVGGLTSPVFVTAAPGDALRLFIVQQNGLIRILRDGTLRSTPFLDLSGLVASGGERGLLGMAFHAEYALNGWFFVNYTDGNGNTKVVRYTVSADRDVADPGTALEILSVAQPYSNHNGGMLEFGPRDGLLYIGLGDGGGAGDPDGNAQDRSSLLGSMLRIDVNTARPAERYRVPPGNPFVGVAGVLPEIWAYGLRNPWRYSFDPANGDLYIADVGQNRFEEVSVHSGTAVGGQNYGWPRMEGEACYRPSTGCNTGSLVLPAYTYDHDEGCSITGGYVYRGSAIPALRGRYLFADFCEGWVRSFVMEGGEATDVRDLSDELAPGGNIVSFGRDGAGELYIVVQSGEIYRIVPA